MTTAKTSNKTAGLDAATQAQKQFGEQFGAQFEALVKSGNLFMKGSEQIVKTYASLAQESAEKGTDAMKSLMGCKTLSELTAAQTRLAQDAIEDFVANATKLSELTTKVTTDSFEPINDQMTKAMKKASESMAA